MMRLRGTDAKPWEGSNSVGPTMSAVAGGGRVSLLHSFLAVGSDVLWAVLSTARWRCKWCRDWVCDGRRVDRDWPVRGAAG